MPCGFPGFFFFFFLQVCTCKTELREKNELLCDPAEKTRSHKAFICIYYMGRHRQDSYSSINWFAGWLLPKVVKSSNTEGNKKKHARPMCRFEIGWKERQGRLPCIPWCCAEEAEAPAGAALLKCSRNWVCAEGM